MDSNKKVSVFLGGLVFVLFTNLCFSENIKRSELINKADIAFSPFVENHKNAGISVGIIYGSETFTKNYGVKDLQSNLPPDANTIYEIGSITKVFTATALAKLAIEEKVDFNDTIEKYLPKEQKTPIFNGQKIKLIHLATHTSGLPRLPSNIMPYLIFNAEDPYANYDAKRLYDFLSGYDLKKEPGKINEYSNLGMGLMGQLLVNKHGGNYETLIQETISKPLKMNNTFVNFSKENRKNSAQGYSNIKKILGFKANIKSQNWNFDALSGAGALKSSVNDMLKFLEMNIEPDDTTLGEALKLTHINRVKVDEQMSVGLGWHILNMDNDKIIWHNGETGGFHSFIGFSKDYKIGVVILSNTANSFDTEAFGFLRKAIKLCEKTKKE